MRRTDPRHRHLVTSTTTQRPLLRGRPFSFGPRAALIGQVDKPTIGDQSASEGLLNGEGIAPTCAVQRAQQDREPSGKGRGNNSHSGGDLDCGGRAPPEPRTGRACLRPSLGRPPCPFGQSGDQGVQGGRREGGPVVVAPRRAAGGRGQGGCGTVGTRAQVRRCDPEGLSCDALSAGSSLPPGGRIRWFGPPVPERACESQRR